jgi:hypothetical protein
LAAWQSSGARARRSPMWVCLAHIDIWRRSCIHRTSSEQQRPHIAERSLSKRKKVPANYAHNTVKAYKEKSPSSYPLLALLAVSVAASLDTVGRYVKVLGVVGVRILELDRHGPRLEAAQRAIAVAGKPARVRAATLDCHIFASWVEASQDVACSAAEADPRKICGLGARRVQLVVANCLRRRRRRRDWRRWWWWWRWWCRGCRRSWRRWRRSGVADARHEAVHLCAELFATAWSRGVRATDPAVCGVVFAAHQMCVQR